MNADQPRTPPTSSADGPEETGTQVQFTSDSDGTRTPMSFVWHGDEIQAVGDVTRRTGGLAISRLEVSAPESTPGLTHQLLRKVPLGEILAAARARVAHNEVTHLHLAGGPSKYTLPPGRVQVTDDLLRQVALAYLYETGPGKDRAVLQRLSERFDRPKGTLRTWLGRAREEGWLGPAVQGRMGADPGPRLLDEFARMPAAKRVGEVIQITAPPPEGSESVEETRARALAAWRQQDSESGEQ